MSDKYIAFGVYGNQTYGPYTQKDLDFREESSTNYLDTIIMVSDDEDIFETMADYES
jgi:hypothetical protein